MSENFKISCSLKRTPVWASKETLDIILIILFGRKIIRFKLDWYVEPNTEAQYVK